MSQDDGGARQRKSTIPGMDLAQEKVAAKAKAMKQEEAKVRQVVMELSGQAPAWAVTYVQMAAPACSWIIVVIKTAFPYLYDAFCFTRDLYRKVDDDILHAAFGFMMCFFGGFFPTLIAVFEACKETGWKTIQKSFNDIFEEADKIVKKNAEDDKRPEVERMSPHDLIRRKVAMVLKELDADKFSNAMGGLFTSALAVVAVLKVKFARTIALGTAIGENVKPVAEVFMKPILMASIPEEYRQWIPVIINYVCKMMAMTIAWYVQMVISAFHSAIRGGLKISRAFWRYAYKNKWVDKPSSETMMDEYVGWGLAAIGFLFQMLFNFRLPFPLNVIMLPLTLAEGIIRMVSNF